jgi:phospholipid transport system transporter-binding protein
MIHNQPTWALSGALTIETALETLAQGQQQIANAHGSFTVDLAKIDSIDSAGIAVLLEWQRFANTKHIHLSLINPPTKLRSMIHLSELDGILRVG